MWVLEEAVLGTKGEGSDPPLSVVAMDPKEVARAQTHPLAWWPWDAKEVGGEATCLKMELTESPDSLVGAREEAGCT